MKKMWKIVAGGVAVLLIAGILFIANAFVGNPISKAIARRSAEKYMEATYPNQGYEIENVGYNFKFGNYVAHIVEPDSLDNHFTVNVSMLGEIGYDSHDYVTMGWNTFERINQEYRERANKVLDAPEYPLNGYIKFGEIKEINTVEVGFEQEQAYGIDMSSLELDQTFDITEIGKIAGRLTIYAEDKEISAAKAAEKLLILKDYLEKNKFPFYAIDFVLEKPRKDGMINPDHSDIQVGDFRYSDIYEEGLVERVQQANDKLKEHYEKLDKEMKK